MYCAYCGQVLPTENPARCPYCGGVLRGEPDLLQPPLPPQYPSRNPPHPPAQYPPRYYFNPNLLTPKKRLSTPLLALLISVGALIVAALLFLMFFALFSDILREDVSLPYTLFSVFSNP